MSGLLFLAAVGGFVLIAYWAFQNDTMQPQETGSGLLAMRVLAAANAKPVPKWKKAPALEVAHRPSRAETPSKKPFWRQTLLYGGAR